MEHAAAELHYFGGSSHCNLLSPHPLGNYEYNMLIKAMATGTVHAPLTSRGICILT